MSFFLYLQQKGQGCDYTIGCGERLIGLKARTRGEAAKEIIKILEDHGFLTEDGKQDREAQLERAILFTAAEPVYVKDVMMLRRLKAEEAAQAQPAPQAQALECSKCGRKDLLYWLPDKTILCQNCKPLR